MEGLIKELCLNETFKEHFKPMTEEEYAKYQADLYNSSEGNLKYVDCKICRNKGYIQHYDECFNTYMTECECMTKRKSIARLQKSGLGNLIELYTFDSYTVQNQWQKRIKDTALEYIGDTSGSWFYIGGQSGCGKTHICTAISVALINQGRTLKYEIWRNLFHRLQSLQFDNEKYNDKLNELQSVDVLYIDDFMKSLDRSKINTELNFAFEIINSRYTANKPTIISSEFDINQINALDNALAGRIVEKAGKFTISISGSDKNYRLN